MDNLSSEISNDISEKVSAVHNRHATDLLKRADLDPVAFAKDPSYLKSQGYVFVHEADGNEHRFAIAKVIVEDRYTLDVKFTVDSADTKKG